MTTAKSLPPVDEAYLIKTLTGLLNTPSPTGFMDRAVAFVEADLKIYADVTFTRTRKGALVATWTGAKDDNPRALTAHLDTLGAVVKEIKPNGRTASFCRGWVELEQRGSRRSHGFYRIRQDRSAAA